MTEVLTAPAPLAPEPAPAPLTVRRVGTETLIALAVGLVAAIAVTWPLVTKLGHIGHDPFDPRFQAWTIDWVQHKLGSPGSLFDANIFAPEPHTLAYSDSLLGIAIPLLPLRWLGVSPIGQLNIALLLGMATSAAAGYLFGRVVTRSVTVGALTAAAFAFGPFGSVSSGALHATAHAGVGVAAAAAWWLADRAESPATPVAARTRGAHGRGHRLAGVGVVLPRRVRVRRRPGPARGAVACARAARLVVGARGHGGGGAVHAGDGGALPPGARRAARLPPLARRPPGAERRLRQHRPAPLALGLAARQGLGVADLRRAGVPGDRAPRAGAGGAGQRVARARSRATGRDRRRRAGARGRRARHRCGSDGLAPLRALPAPLRVRAGMGGVAGDGKGVGGRAPRRGPARRLRCACRGPHDRARDARPHARSSRPRWRPSR